MGEDNMDDLMSSFKMEALEMVDESEGRLLAIEKGEKLSEHFDSIFRCLHSIKGGAGIFDLKALQEIVHEAETRFTPYKKLDGIAEDDLSYFISVMDQLRSGLTDENSDLMRPGSKKLIKKSDDASRPSAVGADPANSKWKGPDQQVKAKLVGDDLVAVVIDDEQEIVEIIQELLETSGFKVHGFSKPKLAFEKIFEIKPDVVLCDMNMPGMSGMDVLKKIREKDSNLPVIFVSAHLDKDILINAINNGADGVAEKPFRNEYIQRLARNAGRRHRIQKLFDKTINLMLYQYSDFDDYLVATGKDDVRRVIENEMGMLIEQRRMLRELGRKLD